MFTSNEIVNIFEKYLKGEDNGEFKKYSSLMGIYTERNNDKYMIRYRFTGGIIKPSELEGIANILKDLEYKSIHFTTRQDLQFHKLSSSEVIKVIKSCNDLSLSSAATGGPGARNIQISPLAGVVKDEPYNITPYVLKASEYILNNDPVYSLPKKYKISVSNTNEDTVNATISDLGIFPSIVNGEKRIKVYGGGGLGAAPRIGIVLYEYDKVENILYHMLAMRKIFDEHGDRKIKAKARVRHILQRLGDEKFRNLYLTELLEIKNNKDLKIVLTEEEEKSVENKYEKSYEIGGNVHPLIKFGKYRGIIKKQKQREYYSIYIHPDLGDMPYDYILKVTNLIESLNYNVTLRLTNTQGFYIRDVKSHDVEKILRILPNDNIENIFSSVSCTGAGTCKLGILKSKSFLKEIINVFENEKKLIRRTLPRIYISGCPNSCGQHLKGELGFCGRVRKGKLGLIPYYGIFVNGYLSNEPRLSYEIGELPARNITKFLVELAKLKIDFKIKDFNEFITQKENEVKKLIEDFSRFNEENEKFYTDFGDTEKFILKSK